MVENYKGEVAVVYQHPTDKTIKVTKDASYRFLVKNNVSLSWVHIDHLQAVLTMRRDCVSCNPTMFRLADQGTVNKWYG